MMKYFKHLGFYFLTVVDAFINFVCSVFGAYPTIDISTTFLLLFEMRRVNAVLGGTEKKRSQMDAEATQKFEEAKDSLDG